MEAGARGDQEAGLRSPSWLAAIGGMRLSSSAVETSDRAKLTDHSRTSSLVRRLVGDRVSGEPRRMRIARSIFDGGALLGLASSKCQKVVALSTALQVSGQFGAGDCPNLFR